MIWSTHPDTSIVYKQPVTGLRSSVRRTFKNEAEWKVVLKASAISSTLFVVVETVTGIVSLVTGKLSMPPMPGIGTVIVLSNPGHYGRHGPQVAG